MPDYRKSFLFKCSLYFSTFFEASEVCEWIGDFSLISIPTHFQFNGIMYSYGIVNRPAEEEIVPDQSILDTKK